MVDKSAGVEDGGFDPRHTLSLARRARSRAEKFDAFSDVYIWVMILGLALAYAFGLLRAGLGALLGEFAESVLLPSALVPLSEVLLPSVLIIPVVVLRLLLNLGPAAVTGAQGYWWLSLPIDQRKLRRLLRKKATLIGVFGAVSAWLLWYTLCSSVLGNGGWTMLVTGVLGAALSGAGLADAAVIIQHRGSIRRTQKLLNLLIWLLVLWCAGQWVLRAGGILSPGNETLRDISWNPGVFGGALLLSLILWVCLWPFSRDAAQQLEPKVLRAAGQRQSGVHAALFMMDFGALGGVEPAQYQRPSSWPTGRMTQVLSIPLEIVGKRIVRHGRHRPLVVTPLLCAGLLLLVRGAANPVSLVLMTLVILTQWMLVMSNGFEPLLSNGTWPRLLGLGRRKIGHTMFWVVGVPSLLSMTVLALAGVILLGVPPSYGLWLAVLLAGVGVVAGVEQRTRNREQDLVALVQQIGTSVGALSTLSHILSGILPTLMAALPLIVTLLLGAGVVPWFVWLVAVGTVWPGIKLLIPGHRE